MSIETKEDISYKRNLITSLRMRFSPEVQQSREAIVDNLVQRILYSTNKDIGCNIKDIQTTISKSFGINIVIEEVCNSITRLIDTRLAQNLGKKPDRLVFKGKDSSIIKLTEDAVKSIEKSELESTEKFSHICSRLFGDSQHGWEKYEKPFLLLLANIFARLGEDNVKMILGELPPHKIVTSSYFTSALNSVNKYLKHLDSDYFESAATSFFQDADPDYAQLKWKMAQNYYILKVIGLDRESILFSRELFNNAIFYLDTNIVISALSPEETYHESFIKLSNICQELGITTSVTTLTIDELNRLVESQRMILKDTVDQIPEATAARISSDFFEIYYEHRKTDDNYPVEQVFDIFANAEDELKNTLKVNTENHQYWFDSIQEDARTKKFSEDLTARYNSMRTRKKKEISANHDALMMLLVEKLRDEHGSTVWFLTRDYTLPSCVPKDSNHKSLAITIDALLQWLLPVDNDLIEEPDIAVTFSEMIKSRVLPQDRIFNIEDFRIFHELDMECKLLPSEDVEDCIRYMRKNLPLLNPLNPLDREKFARAMKVFFSDPSRKYKKDTQELLARIDALETSSTDQESISLKREAILRLAIVFLVFLVLEAIILAVSSIFGTGNNILQKIVNSWPLILIPLPVCILLGGFYLGKQRLKALGWPIDKFFGAE